MNTKFSSTMPTFDFLNDYLNNILESHKIFLTAKQKAEYLPPLRAQLEQRLGAAFIPLLSKEGHALFGQMLEKTETTEEEWKKFWHEQLPDFEAQTESLLDAFAIEVAEVLAAPKNAMS